MRILQPADWSKPRGFSHGVEVDGPGRWVVLAGQTGGDEKGEYPTDLAAQVARVGEDGPHRRAAPDSGGAGVADGTDLARARNAFTLQRLGDGTEPHASGA